jgi:hypothetical protein
MQTSIEWLEEQIIKFHKWKLSPIHDENCFDEIELDKAIKKAKEIHKQEIINAAIWMPEHFGTEFISELGKQYYNQTFTHE